MCNYMIYDNKDEEWFNVSFAEYSDVEKYVMDDLGDTDFERYSIYERISGK